MCGIIGYFGENSSLFMRKYLKDISHRALILVTLFQIKIFI